MKKSLLFTFSSSVIVAGLMLFNAGKEDVSTNINKVKKSQEKVTYSERKKKMKGMMPFDKPDMFEKFHKMIRTSAGKNEPEYKLNYTFEELKKAKQNQRLSKGDQDIVYTERGPGNVSGRTRGIIVDVSDATNNTWFAGSAGGGIWKTTDAGATWYEKTFNNLNLATTCLVQSPSNPDIMYAGTGEGFGGGGSIKGNGIFKSTDHGETWVQIDSTAGNSDFSYVNRLVVDPNDDKVILASTNTAIMKSIDGGTSWTKVYSASGRVQQIISDPTDFNILYASENSVGILKSTDAGATWTNSSSGIGAAQRMEIAIAPTNNQVLYLSAQAGSESHLYKTEDAAATWKQITYTGESAPTWLGSQGWYDNTVAVNPFNENLIYLGGIDTWKAEIDTASSGSSVGVKEIKLENTESVFGFVNWGGPYAGGGLGTGKEFFSWMDVNTEDSELTAVEIVFGPGKSQKAYRYVRNAESTKYEYKDYVDVPFEAWDVTHNKQISIAFCDWQDDGVFDLIPFDQNNLTREYLSVNGVDYSETPNSDFMKDDGIANKSLFAMWLYAVNSTSWDGNNLPDSKIFIDYGSSELGKATFTKLTDWWRNVIDPLYAHADHHNFTLVKTSESTFRFIDGNDGGVAFSDNGGSTWSQPTNGYNSTQFYGADKHPTKDEYIGGTQDNGSFKSEIGENASKATAYAEVLGGDGFVGVWNNENPDMVLAALYNNRFYRTTKNSNDPSQWESAQTGMADANDDANSAFITTVDKTKYDGYFIVSPGGSGVWRSENFGGTWELANMAEGWSFSTFHTAIAISNADQRVVWAGAWNGYLQVSTDGANSFKKVPAYDKINASYLSGIATHPTEPETAFMIFSQSASPKIVKTTDLGQTWTDITGFEGNEESSNGFPNVAVYDLLVMPYNTNIYWACTEIGIFVSNDAGTSWNYLNDPTFPAVSVWEAGIVGDQVVLATHGRGIWTATIPELAEYTAPVKPKFPRLSQGGLQSFSVSLKSEFDSTHVYIDSASVMKLGAVGAIDTVLVYQTDADKTVPVQVKSYKDGEEYISAVQTMTFRNTYGTLYGYTDDFSDESHRWFGDFTATSLDGFSSAALHSPHPYEDGKTLYHTLRHPIKITDQESVLSYRDVCLVEPGDNDGFWDYVTVEGSKDGLNWTTMIDNYDARDAQVWTDNYSADGKTAGDSTMFVEHQINLKDYFQADDVIFIRFKLYADQYTSGWGWVIDDLKIQEQLVGVDDIVETPTSYELYQNYPNPFNPTTSIKFDVPEQTKVNITIFNSIGERVETLVNKEMEAGQYIIKWDAAKYASGVYFYRFASGDFVKSKKLMLIK